MPVPSGKAVENEIITERHDCWQRIDAREKALEDAGMLTPDLKNAILIVRHVLRGVDGDLSFLRRNEAKDGQLSAKLHRNIITIVDDLLAELPQPIPD